MDITELASQHLVTLSTDPTPQQISYSTAVALWQIVKVLDRIAGNMPQKVGV